MSALSLGISAQPLPTLEVTPAWQGLLRPHKQTELHFLIRPQRGGPAALFISGGSIEKQVHIQLTADTTKELFIPLRLTSNNIISVRLEAPGLAPLAKEIWLNTANTEHVTALALAPPDTPEPANTFALNTEATALPHHAQAYEMIDTLAIDATTLAALSRGQLNALEQFLSHCGHMIGVAMPPQVASTLTEYAGCNGDNIELINNHDLLTTTSTHNLAQTPPPLDNKAQDIRRLARDALTNHQGLNAVTTFFALYLLTLVATRLVTRRTETIIAVAATSSLLAAIAWQGNTPEIRTYSWVEQQSGEEMAHYALLLQHTGNGLGQSRIAMPDRLYDPLDNDDGNDSPAPVYLDLHETRDAELAITTALLNQTELYFKGTLEQDNDISLLNRNGAPRITNRADDSINNAFLLWGNELINLPPIAPRESWTLGEPQSVEQTKVPAEVNSFIAAHKGDYKRALFIPHPPALASGLPQHDSKPGWLVIHAEHG